MKRGDQCQSTGAYCGADAHKLSGLTPPCKVCLPFLPKMRELLGWKPHGITGFFMSEQLPAAKADELKAAFKARNK